MDTEEHINSPRDVPLVQSQSNRSSASSSGDSNTPTWSHIPITDREMLPSPRPPIYGDMEVNSNLVASGIYDNIFVPDSTPPPLLDPPPIPPSPDSILLDVMPPYNGHCGYTGSWEVENPLTLDSISPHGHWQRDARSTCTQISDPPTPDQQPSRNSNQRRDVMDLWDQATALHRENNRDAALKLFNRALDLYTKIIDDDDIIQLPTLGHIAWIFGAQGFHKKALELYNRTMAGYENNGGDDNLERLHIIHDVGLLFEKLKHRKTALKLFTRAQAGYKKTVGDDNPYTLNALHNIGHVYYDLDQIDDAISVYAQAFEGRKRVLGEEHTKTKQSFRCLYNARAARAWAKPVDILRLLNGGAVGPTTLDRILDGSMLSSKSIFPGHA